MTRVDRRPTVARNFIGGDRRSIEWAIEHWMHARPAVTHVNLEGEPLFVAATAQGMHDLGVLHGLGGAPFSVDAHLPIEERAGGADAEVLASSTGAAVLSARNLKPDDVLMVIDADGMDPRRRSGMFSFISSGAAQVILVVHGSGAVHPELRPLMLLPHVHAVPTALDALMLVPQWESVVEDCAPRRLCVAGSGLRMFGASVACGDFFLERLGEVPGRKEGQLLVRDRVAIVEDMVTIPERWTSEAAVHRSVAERAGTSLVTTSNGRSEGVVITPEQRLASVS